MDLRLIAERTALRSELRELKSCQVRYFSLSITATAILLGILGRLFGNPPTGEFFLVPLLVLLPCWWVFFDKATTITRIVAYCRFLDAEIYDTGQQPRLPHIGWENALAEFRARQAEQPGLPAIISFSLSTLLSPYYAVRLLFATTFHRYWLVNWFTFFSLSAACVTLAAIRSSSDRPIWVAAGVLVLAFSGSTAKIACGLFSGRYSYIENHKQWSKIL